MVRRPLNLADLPNLLPIPDPGRRCDSAAFSRDVHAPAIPELASSSEAVFKLGFVFLMAVVAFVLYNDISKLAG